MEEIAELKSKIMILETPKISSNNDQKFIDRIKELENEVDHLNSVKKRQSDNLASIMEKVHYTINM